MLVRMKTVVFVKKLDHGFTDKPNTPFDNCLHMVDFLSTDFGRMRLLLKIMYDGVVSVVV